MPLLPRLPEAHTIGIPGRCLRGRLGPRRETLCGRRIKICLTRAIHAAAAVERCVQTSA